MAALVSQPDSAQLAEPLAPGTAVIGAEVIHTVREEMALTLRDIIVRRTVLGALGDAGPEAVERCGALAARELGWDEARRAALKSST